MKNQIIFYFVEEYPDWESAEAMYFITVLGETKYEVKSVASLKKPICSVSNVLIMPDYTIHEAIGNFSGLIIVGGIGWTGDIDKKIADVQLLIDDAIIRNCSIGGIGTGVDILGITGLLNQVIHTGNSLEEIYLINKSYSKGNYIGSKYFQEAGAIRNAAIENMRSIK